MVSDSIDSRRRGERSEGAKLPGGEAVRCLANLARQV